MARRLLRKLVAAGYRVIRFDYRDTGLSAKLHGQRARGSVYRRVIRYAFGRTSAVTCMIR